MLSAAAYGVFLLASSLAKTQPHAETTIEMLRGVPALPIAAVTTFVAFLAAGAERRSGSVEFLGVAPVSKRARVAAHLLSLLAPMVAVAVLLTVAWIVERPGGADFFLQDGTIRHATVLSPVDTVLAVGAVGALGILLASFTTHPVAGALAAFTLFFSPLTWFDGVTAVYAWSPREGWHLIYVAGLLTCAAALAVSRHDRRVRMRATASVAFATTVVAGLFHGGAL
jgi:hypothetical protein